MAHDATRVLLGETTSSDKSGSNDYASDPATYLAGLAVRVASTGLLSVAKADGRWAGISLGRSLSDHKFTTVLRAGLGVPILLSAAPARQVVTITSYANLVDTANDTLKIGATTFTFKASPSTESEVGAVTSNNQTATNLATKINAHSVAGTLFIASAVGAVVTITAKNNTTDGATIDCVYTDSHSEIGLTVAASAVAFVGGAATAADYVAIGAKVYISDDTGMADDIHSLSTISDAIYVSGVLTGIAEDGTEVACALVDMVGGL